MVQISRATTVPWAMRSRTTVQIPHSLHRLRSSPNTTRRCLSAPALSSQHGTATEHAAPKGFRLVLNPAASLKIGIGQRAAVAVPNQ